MLDKRLWSNFISLVVTFVICVTLWQIFTESDHTMATYHLYSSNSSTYSHAINTLPPDDYQQLINLNNFSFTMLNIPCNDSSLLLLILIHSAPAHSELRNAVRETWGRNTQQVKVVFLVGLVRNSTLQYKIEKENEEFGDLIQGSFIDAYRNMTYKHVMLFKYVIYHCPQAKYILKTDDDVLVNMPLMLNFLTSDLSPFGGSRMLFCQFRKSSMALRSWRSKWRVSFEEYPAKMYPPYCPGFAILYSPDVVFELYKEAQKAAYFWIDDVHITGVLADRIHLTHLNIDKLILTKKTLKRFMRQPSKFNESFLFGSADIKIKEARALWKYVKDKDMHISILRDIR